MSRYRRGICCFAILVLLLSACTGTREDRLPILLVVASADGTSGVLRLYEDRYDLASGTPREITPVAGGLRTLPAPPVAMDFLDRDGSRSRLIVLVRGAGTSQLVTFATQELDPGDSSAFGQVGTAVDLTAVLSGVTPPVDFACLAGLQVTEAPSGAVLAVLFDDGSCGDTVPALHVVDVTAREHLRSPEVPQLLGAGIYLDQGDDRLYFAAETPGRTVVHALALPDGSPVALGATDVVVAGADRSDLAPVSGGIGLLADGEVTVIPPSGDPEVPVEAVTTDDDATSLLADSLGALDELVLYGPGTVAIHFDPVEAERFDARGISGVVGAALEPADRFAYLLSTNGIYVLDLIRREDSPPYEARRFDVDLVGTPLLIDWLYAGSETLP